MITFPSGLSQLALLINLVKNFGANVEAYDYDGMTALCLAAKYDMDIIAEVMEFFTLFMFVVKLCRHIWI